MLIYRQCNSNVLISGFSSLRFFLCLITKQRKMLTVSHLSNAEVLNRWKSCKKQTAKDYWYDFLLTRAKYGDKDAKRYTNFIKQTLEAPEGV